MKEVSAVKLRVLTAVLKAFKSIFLMSCKETSWVAQAWDILKKIPPNGTNFKQTVLNRLKCEL